MAKEAYGPPNPNAYAAARKKSAAKAAAKAATPAPELVTGAGPGQSQPTFSVDDPFLQAGLEVPAGITAPLDTYGAPGSFDKRQAKTGQARGREKSLHVYKTPDEYYGQLETVMGSPVMKNLSEGLAQYKAMHENFLKHAPVQTDLSSLMGLADFLSDKPGKALASYKKPGDYNDLVGKIASLMQQEQGANYNVANLAMNQVPLKAGEESASTKAEVGQEADRGFSVPRPASMMLSPATTAANEWKVINENQKLLKGFSEDKSLLDALKVALNSGNVGSIQRAMGAAARILSRETGQMTNQDIGRVLPDTVGMDLAKFQTYITSNPEVLVDPYIIQGLIDEVGKSEQALRDRYLERHKAFNSQLEASETFGKMPSIKKIQEPNTKIIEGEKKQTPATPQPSVLDEVIKEIRSKNGR